MKAASLPPVRVAAAAAPSAASAAPQSVGSFASGFSFTGAYSQVVTGAFQVQPYAVATAKDGTVYISEAVNNRVLAAAPDGTAAVLSMGSLTPALSGPRGIVLDASGNLYIADAGNNRVVELVAGATNAVPLAITGLSAPNTLGAVSAVAVDANQNVYIADPSNGRIVLVDTSGVASNLHITGVSNIVPVGLAYASDGALYIADQGNNQVEFIRGAQSGILYSLGAAGLASTNGVAVSPTGDVFVADPLDKTLIIVPAGTATALQLQIFGTDGTPAVPSGIAFSAAGNLYIADTQNGAVYENALTAVNLGTAARGFPNAVDLSFAFSNKTIGSVSVTNQGASTGDFSIQAFTTTCKSGLSAGPAFTNCNVSVDFTPSRIGLRTGALLVKDGSGNVLSTVPLFGIGTGPLAAISPGNLSVIAGNGTSSPAATSTPSAALSTGLSTAQAVVTDAAGNLYVADSANHTIDKLDTAGNLSVIAGCASSCSTSPSASGAAATAVYLSSIKSIAIDGLGNLYLADAAGYLEEFVAVSQTVVLLAGGGQTTPTVTAIAPLSAQLGSPAGVAVDSSQNIYLTDAAAKLVLEIPATTGLLAVIGGCSSCTTSATVALQTATQASFTPSTLSVDASSNLFIADTVAGKVLKLSTAKGTIGVVAGGGATLPSLTPVSSVLASISAPVIGGIDAAGSVYLTDTTHKLVERLNTNAGTISLIAGGGTQSASASATSAVQTKLTSPIGVAVSDSAALYIADGSVVEAIAPTAFPLSFATTNVGLASTDSPQTLVLTNVGNSSLSLLPPSTFGQLNPSVAAGFTLSNPGNSGNCPQVGSTSSSFALAAGNQCSLIVGFQPVATGTDTGSIVLTDDSSGSVGAQQSVALTGNGVITGDATSLSVVASATSIGSGATTNLTATVTDTVSGSRKPTGSVTFSDSFKGTLGSATLSNGVATLNGAVLTGDGVHVVTATYQGAPAAFLASSNTANVTVGTATHITITAGSSATLDIPFQFQVTALDANNQVATLYTGTVAITSSDTHATLPANAMLSNGVGSFSVIFKSSGSPTVTATDTVTAALHATVSVSIVAPISYVVTTLNDSVGACTPQTATSTPDASCSLRDALAAASAYVTAHPSAGIIVSFKSSLASVASPGTITVGSAGQFNIPSNTTLQGLTAGAGAGLTNLITIDGGGAYNLLYIDLNETAVTVNNLTLQHGLANKPNNNYYNAGGAITSYGFLTVNQCTIANNTYSGTAYGTGIYSVGPTFTTYNTLLINNSTFYGNTEQAVYLAYTNATINNSTFTANSADGGAAIVLQSGAALQLNNSTITGNSTRGSYGSAAVYVQSAGSNSADYPQAVLTMANSIIAGNTATYNYADLQVNGAFTDQGGNIYYKGSATTTPATTPALVFAPLGNYGGPTQTRPGLFGSSSLCAGTVANASAIATDERGLPRTISIGGTPCVDAGAVQTNYSLLFVTQPVSTTAGALLSPAPSVQVYESGAPFAFAGQVVTASMTNDPTFIGGTTVATTDATGLATFPSLSVDIAEVGETLLAEAVAHTSTISAQSAPFNISAGGAPTHFSVAASTPVTAGAAITVTVTALDANNNLAPGYVGMVAITSSDAAAKLPVTAKLAGGTGTFTFTFSTPGSQTITATDTVYPTLTGTTAVQVSLPHTFIVTTLGDTTSGVAANCTDQSLANATLDANCSLRDALAATVVVHNTLSTTPVSITFAATLATTTPQSIVLGNAGSLYVGGHTTITGLTTGTGAKTTNLIVIDGNAKYIVVQTQNGNNIVLNNLVITNGYTTNPTAAGLYNVGSLTLNNVSITNNKCLGCTAAGLELQSVTSTINNSTISGNDCTTSVGCTGGIIATAYIYLNNTTIFGNSGTLDGGLYLRGGGAINASTIAGNKTSSPYYAGLGIVLTSPTITNSVLSNNTNASGFADCYGTGCATNGTNGNIVAEGAVGPLAGNGGPTQTALPLPGGGAICAVATPSTGLDQRGQPRTTSYSGTSCQDSGAVQSNFALKFTVEPVSTAFGVSIAPAPAVSLFESGTVAALSGATINVAPLAGILGGTTSVPTVAGVASFTGLSLPTTQADDLLIASLTLSSSKTIKATSSEFSILAVSVGSVTATTGATQSATVNTAFATALQVKVLDSGGNPLPSTSVSFSAPSSGASAVLSATSVQTDVNGLASITATAGTVAGAYTVTASVGGTTATFALTNLTGTAAIVNAVSGSAQTATIGTAFANPLLVKVTDAFANPVAGATVSFTPPATGASATLSTPAVTATDGTTSVTATANGVAGATAYVVAASVSGGTTAASFSLTNSKQPTTLTVTPAVGPFVYGQSLTIAAAIAPSTAAGNAPSGVVVFYDGGNALSPSSTVAAAAASYTVSVPTVGTHSFSAQYTGDNSFAASTVTAASGSTAVGKASSALSGPATTTQLVAGQGGVVPITVTGQFSGTGISTPTGSVGYTILNSASVTQTSGTSTITAGAVSIPVPSTLAPGVYSISLTYTGDSNYNAATSISVSVQTGKVTPAVSITAPGASITYGSTLGIAATATSGGTAVAGTFAYTATISGGSAVAVTASTVLTAGTYTLSAAFTPTDPTAYNSTSNTAALTVNPFTPVITWSNPADIAYGTALGSTQLNAAVAGVGGISLTASGTLVYTPVSGTSLNAGTAQPLKVTFTPADSVDYTSVSKTVAINVTAAAQTITFTPPATPLVYGSATSVALSATGGASGNPVVFSVTSGPGTIAGATLTITGAGSINIAANQAAGTNYAAATAVSQTLVVNAAASTLTGPGTTTQLAAGQGGTVAINITGQYAGTGISKPSGSIGYVILNSASVTQASGSSTISAGAASIPIPATLAPGTYSISVTFAGDINYNAAATISVSVQVGKYTPAIALTAPGAALTYGTALGIAATATSNSASVAGIFTYTATPSGGSASPVTASSVLSAGTYTLTANFTPTDLTTYTSVSSTASLTVNPFTPIITWSNPADITYGTALGSTQLNAAVTGAGGISLTASGTLAYTPAAGATLSAGSAQQLKVTFSPTDAVDYTVVSKTVAINVLVGTQSITFTPPATPIVYGSATSITLSATGGASGNPVVFSVTSGPGSIAGSTLTITGTGSIKIAANQAASGNYAAATAVSQTLVVNPAASTLAGPATQPVFVVYQQTGSVPVTVTGQYSGSGITPPSGAIVYTILNSSSASVASGTLTIAAGAVTVPVASTLPPGLYTVQATYAGDTNYTAATSVTINLQVGQIQPVAVITAPGAALTYNVPLGIAATASYNSATVAGTFTYAATPSGGTASTVTAASVLPAGSYTLTANFTPTDTITYKSATASAPLTVNKAASAVALTTSAPVILVQNQVVFTATVTSSAGIPSGSVNFYDNTASTSLGTVTLVAGVAALPATSLAVGTHSITAIYAGDTNFLSFTSPALSEEVDDFTLILTGAAVISQSVYPGQTATFVLPLAPSVSFFPSPVTLSVDGVPPGFIVVITPSVILPGSGPTTVTVTITPPAAMARSSQSAGVRAGSMRSGAGIFALALLLLPFSRRLRGGARGLQRVILALVFLTGAIAASTALTGCGTSTGFFAQAPQTYTISFTATAGALKHSTNLTLTVQ